MCKELHSRLAGRQGSGKGSLGVTVHHAAPLSSFASSAKWVSSSHQPTLSDRGESRDWRDSFLNCDPLPLQNLSHLLPYLGLLARAFALQQVNPRGS